MQEIPKIIHQIWSGIAKPLPEHFKVLGETWKEHYPDWEYRFWDDDLMNKFVQKNYPQFWNIFINFPFNAQRWDAVRYLILDKIGGMYVDFDYESIKPINELIKDKTCCFALEPLSHSITFGRDVKEQFFNNALMLSIPGHPFMRKIIKTVFSEEMLACRGSKSFCVLNTTGPWVISNLYYQLSEKGKKDIYLIPAKYVTPFSFFQANCFIMGEMSEELEKCLDEAYAVHYFFGDWKK